MPRPFSKARRGNPNGAISFALGPDGYIDAIEEKGRTDLPPALFGRLQAFLQRNRAAIRQMIIDAAVEAYTPQFLADARALYDTVIRKTLGQ